LINNLKNNIMKCINCSNEIVFDDTVEKYKCKSCGTRLSIGDIVHHKTNDKIKMIISGINGFRITCHWIDTIGCCHEVGFGLFELELDKFKEE